MAEDKAEPPDHLDPDKVFAPDTAFSFTYLQNLGDGSPNPEKNRLKEVLRTLDKSNIRLGECVQPKANEQAMLRDGNTSYCARLKVAPKDEGGEARDVLDAVVRIDPLDYTPLLNPVSLYPAWRKEFPDQECCVSIVPCAPDAEGKTVTDEDRDRTIAVLKRLKVTEETDAEGKRTLTCDVATDQELQGGCHTAYSCAKDLNYLDQYVFLKKPGSGEYYTYPPEAGEGFAGKEIAFLRDCGCVGGALPIDSSPSVMLDEKFNIIRAAPAECAVACMQQYERTRQLERDLHEAGIKPNVPIPETTGPSTMAITGVVPVQSENKLKGPPL